MPIINLIGLAIQDMQQLKQVRIHMFMTKAWTYAYIVKLIYNIAFEYKLYEHIHNDKIVRVITKHVKYNTRL